MVNAQDKALATLCLERGLLDDDAVERARLAHAELLERGEPAPLGNLLVQRGFLQPAIAAGLLRELALASFLCPRCERGWTYEDLAQLSRYRCEACGERLIRKSKSTRSSVAAPPDATEVDHNRPRSASGRSTTATSLPRGPLASSPPHTPGVRNTAVSMNVPSAAQLQSAANRAVVNRPSSTGPTRISQVVQRPSATGVVRPSGAGPTPPQNPLSPQNQSGTGMIIPTNGQAAPARTLGPYEILSELGRGAMGVVYLGRRPGLERLFAIKVLLGGALADPEAVERFRREAALASRIQHPNVVPVYDVGVANGYYYYVMEHCPGRTLKQVLEQRGRLPGDEAAKLVSKIARGVGAAHNLGVVHRDVKPANVMMEARTGNPRVADFGLARDASQGDTGVTRTGDLIGTPSYMAPEQLVGKRGVDTRADVYSLGVVLYELIAGVRPFLAETTAELAAKVLHDEPTAIRQHVPDISRGLAAIVSKAIDKLPEKRYANAGELADDLDRFSAGEPVLARPETALARLWRLSKKKILVVAAILVVLGMGGGIGAWRLNVQQQAHDVDRFRQELGELERDSRLRMDGSEVTSSFERLSAAAPAALRADVQVCWATCLARRGQIRAAYDIAQSFVSAPNENGLEARRLLVDYLYFMNNSTDAGPLAKSLEESASSKYSDWVRIRKIVFDPKAQVLAAPPDLRERASKSGFGPSLRLLAELERRADDSKSATEHLTLALNSAPDDALARLALANVARGKLDLAKLRAEGDHDARKDVEAAIAFMGKEADSNGLAQYERARTAAAEHRWSDAVRSVDAAIASGHSTADAYTLRSWFADDRARICSEEAKKLGGDPGAAHFDARDRLELAGALTPDVAKRLHARAQATEPAAREKLESALESSARGDRFEVALAAFDEADKLAPRNPVVGVERLRFLMSRGHLTEAIDSLNMVRTYPGAPTNEILLLELETRWRQGRRQDAKAAAKALADADPEGVLGLVAQSFTARCELSFSEAIDHGKEAVAAAPDSAVAHRFLALAYCDSLDGDAGEIEAVSALRLEARLDLDNQFTGVYATILSAYLSADAMGGPPGGGGREGRRVRGGRDGAGRDGPGRDGGGGGEAGGGWERRGRDKRTAAATDAFDSFVSEFPIAFYVWERGFVVTLMTAIPNSFGFPVDRSLLETAREDYLRASKLDPTAPLGDEGVGIVSAYENDLAAATESWSKARALDPRWELPKELLLKKSGGCQLRSEYSTAMMQKLMKRGGR